MSFDAPAGKKTETTKSGIETADNTTSSPEDWRAIADAASKEQDSEKLCDLVNQLLDKLDKSAAKSRLRPGNGR